MIDAREHIVLLRYGRSSVQGHARSQLAEQCVLAGFGRGFPVEKFKGDRLGLVLAFWGLGIVLGRPLVSQTDYTKDLQTFGESEPATSKLHIHLARVGQNAAAACKCCKRQCWSLN